MDALCGRGPDGPSRTAKLTSPGTDAHRPRVSLPPNVPESPPRRAYSLLFGALVVCLLLPLPFLAVSARSTVLPPWIDPDSPSLAPLRAELEAPDADVGAVLLRHFRSRPAPAAAVLPEVYRDSARVVAEDLRNGRFAFLGKPAVALPADLAWDENPYGMASWNWSLHTMSYVADLAAVYRETGDTALLERAEALVLDWIEDHPPATAEGAKQGMAWDDHATALRARHWLSFWETWVSSPLATPEKLSLILGAIAAHAAKLADPAFYTERHNHGVDQDLSLLSIAAWLPELRGADDWLRLGVQRLQTQIEAVVSPRGVTLEHSPAYHFNMMTSRLQPLHEIFTANPQWPDRLDLDALLGRMAGFLAWSLAPDNHLPLIGDTNPRPTLRLGAPLRTAAQRSPLLHYALTNGAQGTPGKRFELYRDEGYAFFRDSWLPPGGYEDAFYVAFTAAAHRGRGHKQWDDLSFVLSAFGAPLLVDAGAFSYDHDHPARRFVVSSLAHNTVIVDDVGFEGWSAKIEAGLEGEGFAAVRASHVNYPGWRNRRTLVHVRPHQLVVVDDVLPTDERAAAIEHTFDQLFHLAPHLAAEQDPSHPGDVVARDLHGVAKLWIRQLVEPGRTVTMARGEEDPLRGWVTKAHGELEPATVVATRARGRKTRFVTLITALDAAHEGRAPGFELAEADADEVTLVETAPGGSRLRIGVGDALAVDLRRQP